MPHTFAPQLDEELRGLICAVADIDLNCFSVRNAPVQMRDARQNIFHAINRAFVIRAVKLAANNEVRKVTGNAKCREQRRSVPRFAECFP